VPEIDRAQAAKEGFVQLFSGKDLAGWKMLGRGNASVEDGILQVLGGTGEGAYLCYVDRSFADFTLVVDWMVPTEDGDSGVFLRIRVAVPAPRQSSGGRARILRGANPRRGRAMTPSGQVVDVWEGIPALEGRPRDRR